MKTWPKAFFDDIKSHGDVLRYLCRTRDEDVDFFNNLNQVFLKGRKTARVPVDYLDVLATDRVGDFNYDHNYMYVCVDNVGVTEWRFIPMYGTTVVAGTVTDVSVTTANGVSGTVANSTTTPAISLTLGAITPSSVAATGNVTGTNLSGTNTGDQTIYYTHTQGAASTTWTINHNLGYNPSIALLSVGGVVIDADITHTSVNQAVATFVSALAGTAHCS